MIHPDHLAGLLYTSTNQLDGCKLDPLRLLLLVLLIIAVIGYPLYLLMKLIKAEVTRWRPQVGVISVLAHICVFVGDCWTRTQFVVLEWQMDADHLFLSNSAPPDASIVRGRHHCCSAVQAPKRCAGGDAHNTSVQTFAS